jgi:hypothetical protein
VASRVVDLELERLIRRLDKAHKGIATAIEASDAPATNRLHDDLKQVAQVLDGRAERFATRDTDRSLLPATTRRLRLPKTGTRRKSRLSRDSEGIHIAVDFESTTDRDLLPLYYDVASAASKGASIFWVEEANHPPLRFASGTAALQYLVLRLKTASPKRENFIRKERPLNKAHESFRALAERCGGQTVLNTSSVRGILNAQFGNRYCIIVPEVASGQLILMEFGDGYQHIDGSYNIRCAGRPFGQFESREYTSFVQQAYKEAWRRSRPVVEQITVPTSFDGNLPPSYERMIVPIRLATGPALLSATHYRE